MLFQKVWDAHIAAKLQDGAVLLYIDRHLINEVTSPQAFEGFRAAGRKVSPAHCMFAVADHKVPTEGRAGAGAAIAAPLPLTNVHTDTILPGRFLKTIHRKGSGDALFADLRDDPDFVLNRPPWSEACILVAFENFGCGSSREHAPWALLDLGIRFMIAPSIADIFYNKCCKNEILQIALPLDAVVALMHDAEDLSGAGRIVDLPGQTIINCDGRSFHFVIDARRKHDLMEGTDDIRRFMMNGLEITAYEPDPKAGQPGFPAILQCRLTGSKSGIHEC